MLQEINRKKPIANKQHRCDFCAGIIEKGEKYDNCTYVFDGHVYTWKSHLHCLSLVSRMEDWTGQGISSDEFEEWLCNYVYENHYDSSIDDISKEWQNKSASELAKMVYEEIKAEYERLRPDMQEIV